MFLATLSASLLRSLLKGKSKMRGWGVIRARKVMNKASQDF